MAIEHSQEVHIPVTVDCLTEAMSAELTLSGGRPDAQRQEVWTAFVKNLQVVVAVYYDSVTSRIRGVYKEAPSRRTWDQRVTLLHDLCHLLEAAQYQPLSEPLFRTAQQAQYEFQFPSTVDWRKLCPEFLGRFYRTHFQGGYLEAGVPVPEFARHLLIHTRGVESAQKTGVFLAEKLDLLAAVVWAKLCCLLRIAGRLSGQVVASPTASKRRRHLRRVLLEDICRQRGLFNVLFSQVTIVEPCFSNVIMCYRSLPTADNSGSPKAAAAPSAAAAAGAAQEDQLRRRGSRSVQELPPPSPSARTNRDQGIQIALFDRVPFGDLDALFPHKQIDLRPFDGLQFLVYIAAACMTVLLSFTAIWEEGGAGGGASRELLLLAFVVISGAVKQAYGLYVAYVNLKAHYYNAVQDFVRQRTVASGMPVVSHLVDDVKEQELKELMLGYYFLWRHGGEMSTESVGDQAEAFLRDRLGVHDVAFDIDDALCKLQSLGLVQACGGKDSDARFRVAINPERWLKDRATSQISPPALQLRSTY